MTERKPGLGELVNRRTLLLGVLGTVGAVVFGGAVYESQEKPRDGEALQALHAVQTAAAEVAERGVNGQTTSEETIAAMMQRESGAMVKIEVAFPSRWRTMLRVRGRMRQLERIWWMDY